MAVYVGDSSALVKRYVRERGTAWVRGLTDPAAGHTLSIAGITGVEVVSALTRQTRRGALAPTDAARAYAIEHREGEVLWHRYSSRRL